MDDMIKPNDVLSDILRVLERIEVKLDGHEERFQSTEEHTKRSLRRKGTEVGDGHIDTENSTLRAVETPHTNFDALRPSRKGTPTNDDQPDVTKTALKIPYNQWSINQLDRFFNLTLSISLQKRLGDCWGMPDDDRLPLKFFKTNILKTNAPWGPLLDSFPTVRQPIERDLEFLCQFDDDLRIQPGNDFMVVDFDTLDNSRLYRLGAEAIGTELEIEPQGNQSAPWSRLMCA